MEFGLKCLKHIKPQRLRLTTAEHGVQQKADDDDGETDDRLLLHWAYY